MIPSQSQHDKIRRKALLAPNPAQAGPLAFVGANNIGIDQQHQLAQEDSQLRPRGFGVNLANAGNLDVLVGGMEANRVGAFRRLRTG